MKEGWVYKKLGEVCEVINGLWKGKKPPFVNVGVIRNANFTKEFTLRYDNIEYLDVEERQDSKRQLQTGDLIVEKSGGSEKQPVGRAVLFEKEEGGFSFSNFTSVLRIKEKEKLLSRFLFLYLLYIYRRGDTTTMQKAATGIHNIELEKYLNIDIPLLDIEDQRRIVSRLDSAFSHIDELKAKAEKQLSEAKALFQKALAEEMKPKEGWEEKTLGEIAKICLGLTHTPKYQESGIPFVSVKDISDGELTFKNTKFISREEFENMPNGAKPQKGDLLFCRVGTIGKPQILQTDIPFGIFVSVGFLRINNSSLTEYVKYWMESPLFYKQVEDNVKGSTLKNLNTGWLKNFTLPVPPINEVSSINSRLDALSSQVRELEENCRKTLAECDALKQAMLREVFE